jgi:hypothetical protein
MTAKDAVRNLRALGALDPVESFLYLANHLDEARLGEGQRVCDATDFAAWLAELAAEVRAAKLQHAEGTCPRCGHLHEAQDECGVFMGASARFCGCQMKVRA